MIIADYPYMVVISNLNEIKGGEGDSKAAATSIAYADGSGSDDLKEEFAAAWTSVYAESGMAWSQSGAKSYIV